MIYFFATSFEDSLATLEQMPEFFADALQWAIDASYVYMAWCSMLALAVYFFKK